MAFLHTIQRKAAQFIQAKPAPLSLERPVVTVSFDDVPRSALSTGRDLVENADGRATFYVAGGLTGALENGQLCHLRKDLIAAKAAGHEIASHGFYHERFPTLSDDAVIAGLAQNDLYLTTALGGDRPAHFAYPFGECALKDKRIVAERFMTGRGVRGGLNHGICDLADLRANALYEIDYREDDVKGLISRAAAANAWLIFFTHDVQEAPTDYGITPGHLADVLRWSKEAGADILPVCEAVPRAFGAAAGKTNLN